MSIFEDDFDPSFIADMDRRFARILSDHQAVEERKLRRQCGEDWADLRDVALGDDDIPEFDF
jgi:hypothetical protein